ncbi:MAG: helix-hairpin-helix domain-containing protein [Candidatus Omnitrophota bacterium]
MDRGRVERIFLIIFAFMFLVGAVLLHVKHRRPLRTITVEKGSIASLLEVRNSIDEKNKININTATLAEIIEIPGVGNVLGGRILAYRDMRGKINDQDELLEVNGIGKNKLDSIAGYITLK